MSGERVLVVDDNERNLKLAKAVLELAGFSVRGAGDAEEAITQLALELPALILMDLQLPGMDGLALTRKLKADPATASVRIVALTAFAMKGDDVRAYQAGCDGYIPKPIDVGRFGAQIAEVLARPLRAAETSDET